MTLDKVTMENMLGAARFDTYYRAADRDLDRAIALYRWNTQLAGAWHSQLSYFEVLLRNSMDMALREWNFRECGYSHWALEHQSADLLYRMLGRPLQKSRAWARKESRRRRRDHTRWNAPFTHDDVVAHLTLGNWSGLLGEALPALRPDAKDLWSECLHKAFANTDAGDASRVRIGKRVERLTRLRNRVSHQENLLETNVRSRMNDMLAVLNAIDARYPAWALSGSEVRQIASQDPRK